MRPRTGASTLILVPTELERARLCDQGGFPPGFGQLAIAGFGPVAAAARTSALLAELTPARVILIGIAGSFDTDRHPVGTASDFDAVAIEGLGVGEGERLVAPPALGFPQWPGAHGSAAIHDRLPLRTLRASSGPSTGKRLLLTTCAASDSPALAARRSQLFPEAIAEDMEGFGVALACALFETPLSIVRGFSNRVGERDPARWRIPSALCAAREIALAELERTSS